MKISLFKKSKKKSPWLFDRDYELEKRNYTSFTFLDSFQIKEKEREYLEWKKYGGSRDPIIDMRLWVSKPQTLFEGILGEWNYYYIELYRFGFDPFGNGDWALMAHLWWLAKRHSWIAANRWFWFWWETQVITTKEIDITHKIFFPFFFLTWVEYILFFYFNYVISIDFYIKFFKLLIIAIYTIFNIIFK